MSETKKKLLVLSQIAEALNREHVTWAVGASLLLYLKGIVKEFHGIAIMVDEGDVEKAKRSLVSWHTGASNPKAQYKPRHFLEFDVKSVGADNMCGLSVPDGYIGSD